VWPHKFAAMPGYLAIVLHAHLPFVRHPEHPKFLEESWLFEAITESYLPLLQRLEDWWRERRRARLTLTLSPTLCAMLRDPLLQARYEQRLDALITLAKTEIQRTRREPDFHPLAQMYHARFTAARKLYRRLKGDLVQGFRRMQERGQIEIITTGATHGLLPLMGNHPPSMRAQILVARDQYRDCFGCDPRGFWLPECAYSGDVEIFLREAGVRWFIVATHGLLHARPRPRYGVFAPVMTSQALAVFGRDGESSRQVWSRTEGYPGDPRYRDFYRDIGFDLDFDYVQPCLPCPEHRGFTGFKYYRITGNQAAKQPYQPAAARQAAAEHAQHFWDARLAQVQQVGAGLDRPPLIVSPYDAELFGHWWYEGPEFLDQLVRRAARKPEALALITPTDYLAQHSTHQVAAPAASSWGEAGYYRVWLNHENEWMHRRLQPAQERMSELVRKHPRPGHWQRRALQQAARELLLAQASDWAFLLSAGTGGDYARQRVNTHLRRFHTLHTQLLNGRLNRSWLATIEARDNLFPNLNVRYWAAA